jgi:diguanylate cyclase (GGDEF)-like protein/PAS domain S-box-containing protein
MRKEMRHTLRTTGKTLDLDVNYVFVPPDTVMVLTEDITDRKQVEDELRQLGTAVQQSSSCVVITDPTGTIEYINPRFTQVYGYTLEEAVGQNPRIISSGSQKKELYQELWATITSGKSWSGEFCNIGKSGQHYWVKATISPVQEEGGTIRHFVGVQEDITELKTQQAQLLKLATTDSLTKLANRRHFLEKCEQETSRCHRYANNMALLMIDIDHFKNVNDSLGHDAGDLVLRNMGRIMEETLRESDLAGRLGGEEFGALLPETDLDQAFRVAERMRKRIEQTRIDTPSGAIGITVSIGIGGDVAGCLSVEELLKQADVALYEAKRKGRNRVVVGPNSSGTEALVTS